MRGMSALRGVRYTEANINVMSSHDVLETDNTVVSFSTPGQPVVVLRMLRELCKNMA